MSVSEQEVKNHIAEMRAAMAVVHTSARISMVVKIAGVIVGFLIIGIFLSSAWNNRVKPLQDMSKWRPILDAQKDKIGSQFAMDKLRPLGEEVAKAYMEEGQKLYKELDIENTLRHEVQALVDELQPLAMSEVQRVRPKLEEIAQTTGDAMMSQLRVMLDESVNRRLAAVLADKQVVLERELKIDEKSAQELIARLRAAGQTAAENMVMRRVKKSMVHIDRIKDQLAHIPDLPGVSDMTQSEMLERLGLTLLARVKLELPDAQDVLRIGEGR